MNQNEFEECNNSASLGEDSTELYNCPGYDFSKEIAEMITDRFSLLASSLEEKLTNEIQKLLKQHNECAVQRNMDLPAMLTPSLPHTKKKTDPLCTLTGSNAVIYCELHL